MSSALQADSLPSEPPGMRQLRSALESWRSQRHSQGLPCRPDEEETHGQITTAREKPKEVVE